MNPIWIVQLSLLCSLGIGLLPVAAIAQPNPSRPPTAELAQSVVNVRSRQPVRPQTLLQKFAQARVVYLGETHDRPEDHQAQLEIIRSLHRLNPRLVIGMEMFQRPYQPVLDGYLRGNLTEAELLDQSQFQKRWGFAWDLYAPVLRFAKEKQLPVIALNTPTEITRKVARSGIESLTPADYRFIPPRSAIALEPETYRQRIRQIYAESHHGKSSSVGFERFFQAQVLWDETMADRISQILQQQPQSLVVVLVGQGHLLYGDGIPSRVARRQPKITQVSVLLNPPEELRKPDGRAIADYFWYSGG